MAGKSSMVTARIFMLFLLSYAFSFCSWQNKVRTMARWLYVHSWLTFYSVNKSFCGRGALQPRKHRYPPYNPGDNTGDNPGDNPGGNIGDNPGYNKSGNTGDNKGPTPHDVGPLTIWQSPFLASCNQSWAIMILPALAAGRSCCGPPIWVKCPQPWPWPYQWPS